MCALSAEFCICALVSSHYVGRSSLH
jgi:hypothetical protein